MIRRLSLLLLVALCGCAATGATVPPSARPPVTPGSMATVTPVAFYPVQRADEPIDVDGILDEFAWATAAQINHFERILNDYDAVLYPTRARMLWDDESLYFSFACQDSDIWAIFDQEDDRMWSEEVVEVFIDPDGDARNYLELEVNPLNAWVDLRIIRLRPDWESSIDWDIAGLQTAVAVRGTVNDASDEDEGWTVEIAIPWAAMADSIDGGGRPNPGDEWRLNLYRIERRAGREAQERMGAMSTRLEQLQGQLAAILAESGVEQVEDLDSDAAVTAVAIEDSITLAQNELKTQHETYHKDTEYTTWSETFDRGFHDPSRFGTIRFTE